MSNDHLKLSGTAANTPGRYANRTEAIPAGKFGSPPKHLSAEHRKIWIEIVKQVPPGVLGNSDRLLIELLTHLTHKLRSATISAGETTQLVQCLGRLGLTPADRNRVAVDPALANPMLPQSKFAKFAEVA